MGLLGQPERDSGSPATSNAVSNACSVAMASRGDWLALISAIRFLLFSRSARQEVRKDSAVPAR